MTTYNNLYLDVRQSLINAGITAASLEAREIVCSASGKTRDAFFRDMQMYAPDSLEKSVKELAGRRLAGEPVAYLIGEWEFFGLPLYISTKVLIPRADTEVLAQAAIDFVKDRGEGMRVLDLCAGSGCVGLAIAANADNCRVLLAELDEEAVQLCKRNVRRNDLTARVTCLRADALQAPPASFGEFDCIVCNPPYIPTADIPGLDPSVRCYEPALALDGGEDGLSFYRAVASGWKSALRPKGRLIFECGVGQDRAVHKIMQLQGFGEIETLCDSQKIARVIIGTSGIQI